MKALRRTRSPVSLLLLTCVWHTERCTSISSRHCVSTASGSTWRHDRRCRPTPSLPSLDARAGSAFAGEPLAGSTVIFGHESPCWVAAGRALVETGAAGRQLPHRAHLRAARASVLFLQNWSLVCNKTSIELADCER